MTRFKQFVKESAENMQQKERDMKVMAYYRQIMEDEGCSLEEAARMTREDPTARIGIKMIDHGLWKLKTEKGRQRFAAECLTAEEQIIWDSPERPRNIAKLIAIGMTETGKQIRVKMKEIRRK